MPGVATLPVKATMGTESMSVSYTHLEQDYTGKAKDIALAYASGIGAGRAGILQTTFKEDVYKRQGLHPLLRRP